jgi:FkbH-like protein
MNKTVPRDYHAAVLARPDGIDQHYTFAAKIIGRSQIVWAEHCTECDYPSCYTSCSFFDPRPDVHCRRFANGMEAAYLEGEPKGPGLTRIRFRKWGKLEGEGPARMHSAKKAKARESQDRFISRTISYPLLPLGIQRSLGLRWNKVKARSSGHFDLKPDLFVLEGWVVGVSPQRFSLTFLQNDPRRAAFQRVFDLAPSYGRISFPVAEIAAHIDLSMPYLVQIEPLGEVKEIQAVFGMIDFVAIAGEHGDAPKTAVDNSLPLVKIVVWDLDETLWTGTLAEDGIEGLKLRPEAVVAIKWLDARGVLQSVASKNDHELAVKALNHFGLGDYFLYPQINWNPKSASVARIAECLNLGLDTFAFIDDQPFERAEVAEAHSPVRTLPETSVAGLPGHPWFNHPATSESAKRRSLYQAEAHRASELEAYSGDHVGFLRAAHLTLDITPLNDTDAERVFELSQRTNQLNFTGSKFTRDDVDKMLAPEAGKLRLAVRCSDRFGEYGLIGFADLDVKGGEMSHFFMSCRVQRKCVEHAFFEHVAAIFRNSGHGDFLVRFHATARNGAAVNMLKDLGFTQDDASKETFSYWRRPIGIPFRNSDIVRIRSHEPKRYKR